MSQTSGIYGTHGGENIGLVLQELTSEFGLTETTMMLEIVPYQSCSELSFLNIHRLPTSLAVTESAASTMP